MFHEAHSLIGRINKRVSWLQSALNIIAFSCCQSAVSLPVIPFLPCSSHSLMPTPTCTPVPNSLISSPVFVLAPYPQQVTHCCQPVMTSCLPFTCLSLSLHFFTCPTKPLVCSDRISIIWDK